MTSSVAHSPRVAVIGGGPAGLMAAEALASRGVTVTLFDAMPSVGRKFLLAGKGGLNLTHSEAQPAFRARYGRGEAPLAAALDAFDSDALRAWSQGLGIDTIVGSSGKVFPADMKAAPLLRAWLQRLRAAGVRFEMRHRWLGWSEAPAAGSAHSLVFQTGDGTVTHAADAVVLALGGASWRRLGSDGAWVPLLAARGVDVAPLRPSNCGFHVSPRWTDHFRERHAGEPLKSVALVCSPDDAPAFRQTGECVVTEHGLEGSLVYAASHTLRTQVERHGVAHFHLDLLPQRTAEWVAAEVAHPRGTRSLSTHLKSRLGLQGAKASLLHERVPKEAMQDAARLAAYIKALPLSVDATRPIDEAISTAGGVSFSAIDGGLQATASPGVFVAGEMLDWEAPTGGYLLTACFATGRLAGLSAAAHVGA